MKPIDELDQYFLVYPARGRHYHDLLDFVATRSATFHLAVQDGTPACAAVERMHDFRILIDKTEYMLGSSPTKVSCSRVTYRCCPESVELLHGLADDFTSWRAPNFPEDLSFWREDGSLVMVCLPKGPTAQLLLTEADAATVALSLPEGALFRSTLYDESPLEGMSGVDFDEWDDALEQAIRRFET